MNNLVKENLNICDDISKEFGATKVKDYKCPSCGKHPSDEYDIDGIEYPLLFNEYRGGTMDGSIHDWDELHFCVKCNIKFWFSNGCF